MDLDERARILALAYRYRQGIEALEMELAHIDRIPDPLRYFVAEHALRAVSAHVAGAVVDECPWDRDDPQRLRSALAELWWQCHNQYLTDYREGRPLPTR